MQKFVLLLAILSTTFAHAVKLTDYQPYNYDVFFTNPKCKAYAYNRSVYANDGTPLRAKPKNTYCKIGDRSRNYNRETSPNFNLRKLIGDKSVTEVFLTYLSFSDSKVAKALCKAIENRNLKVTFIIDSKNTTDERRQQGAMKRFEQVSKCRAKDSVLADGEKRNIPNMKIRGNEGGLGYAHNKLIIAHYKDPAKVTLVFSSGNMSSGTLTHHENWHFVTTNKQSFFYQIHECLRVGMLEYGKKRSTYKNFIGKCRSEIEAPEEEDMKVYLVPSDGKEAMDNIVKNSRRAKSLDVAVHRFTHKTFIKALADAAKAKKEVRFIADDDIFWTGKLRQKVGSNTPNEAGNTNKIRYAGAKLRYIESNESDRQLHHNKFVIFNFADGTGAVHAGAGNFTHAAFSKNYENYYYTTIPEVVEKFRKQYDYMYNELATPYAKLPATYETP
jgi:hypothetical protein